MGDREKSPPFKIEIAAAAFALICGAAVAIALLSAVLLMILPLLQLQEQVYIPRAVIGI